MRKLIVLLVLVGLLFSVVAVSATPVSDLTSLAQYFPASSVVYGAVRTDDAYFENLDAMLARIGAAVGPTSGRLSTMLDMVAQHFDPEGDFQSVFRSWLGDTAAIGVLSLPTSSHREDAPAAVALSVTDRGKAEDFVDKYLRLTSADFSVTTEGSYTLFTITSESGAFAVTDQALFLAQNVDVLHTLALAETHLSDSADFSAALDRLPLDNYDAVAYVNTPALMSAVQEMMPRSGRQGAMMAQMQAMMNVAASQAYGFTLLNNQSFVFDVASGFGDTSGLETAGFALPPASTPLDLSFAAHVPADAPFVVMGSNLADTYNLLVQDLRAMAAMQAEAGNTNARDFDQGLRSAQIFIRGLTGLDLQNDIFGWMTGSYALFAGINPAADLEAMDILPIDFGLAFEATNPEAAAKVVEGIQMALDQAQPENVTFSQEQVAGVDATVITGRLDPDSPFPIEIVVGSNDEVLAIGTRNAVTAIFQPQDGGLAADASFVEAQSNFLTDTAALFYLNAQSLASQVEQLASTQSGGMDEGANGLLRSLSSLVSGASITGLWSEDGAVARFVLTLTGQA